MLLSVHMLVRVEFYMCMCVMCVCVHVYVCACVCVCSTRLYLCTRLALYFSDAVW